MYLSEEVSKNKRCKCLEEMQYLFRELDIIILYLQSGAYMLCAKYGFGPS